ncbi:hypothetical protein [Sulfitobacter sp. SK012]|uniref:hypothetical protein n=1 Tax=Sulfitobacter sp. SK012 TaxID=1389005 RepID=UPI001C1F33A1|nr:hypothetical protein [Sulfitobacter sp. SK012]
MAAPLAEYFGQVTATDIYDYGYGGVSDFLTSDMPAGSHDWVITNPPFRLAEEFILRGLDAARRGVAVLVRTVFLESVGRYERLFSTTPPSTVAQFVERVPMVKGRLDKKASTATGYAWVVWEKRVDRGTQLLWVPPCRKKLERASDYEGTISSSVDATVEIVREDQSKLLL